MRIILLLALVLPTALTALDLTAPVPEAVTEEQKKWYRYTEVTLAAIAKHKPEPRRPVPPAMIMEILEQSPELLAYIKSEVFAHPRQNVPFVNDDGTPTQALLEDPISAFPAGDSGWHRIIVKTRMFIWERNVQDVGFYGGKIPGTNAYVRIGDDVTMFSQDTYRTDSRRGQSALCPHRWYGAKETLVSATALSFKELVAWAPHVVLLNPRTQKYEITIPPGRKIQGVPLLALGCFIGGNSGNKRIYYPPEVMLTCKMIPIDTPNSEEWTTTYGAARAQDQSKPKPQLPTMRAYRSELDQRADVIQAAQRLTRTQSAPGTYMRANIDRYNRDFDHHAARMRSLNILTAWVKEQIEQNETQRKNQQADPRADLSRRWTDTARAYVIAQAARIRADAMALLGARRKEFLDKDRQMVTFAQRLQKHPAYLAGTKGSASAIPGLPFTGIRPTTDIIADGYFTDATPSTVSMRQAAEESRIAFLRARIYYADTVKDPEVIATIRAEDAYHEAAFREAEYRDNDSKERASLVRAAEEAKRIWEERRTKHPLPPLPDELAAPLQALSGGMTRMTTATYKIMAEQGWVE